MPKLADISVRDFVLEQLKDVPEFLHPLYNEIYQEIMKSADEPWTNSFFLNHPNEQIRDLAINLLTEAVEISENWEKKWDIHLQTQTHPIDNFYLDSLQATLRLKLERVQLISHENITIMKSLQDQPEIEKHLKIQEKLIGMKKELANQLRAIVLE